MQLQEADKVFNLAAFSGCPPLCFSSVGISIRSMVFRGCCGPMGTVLGKDYWQWEIKSVKGGSEIAKKMGKRSYKSNDFSERRWPSRREPVLPGEKCQALPWRKNPSISVYSVQGQIRTTMFLEPTGLFSLHKIEAEEARDTCAIRAAVGRQRDEKQTRNLGI